MRLHLKCCIKLWGPQHEKNIYLFKQFQKRTTKIICRLEHLSYRDRLRELRFFRLEKKLQEDLIVAF